MRPWILLAAALLAAPFAQAQDEGIPLTREEAAALKTVDLNELEAKIASYDGQTVKLRFTSRSEKTTDLPDDKLRSSLFYYKNSPDPRKGGATTNGGLLVFVPPAGKEWFLKLTTIYTSRATQHVIARLSRSAAGQPQGELLGREVRTDFKGSRIVW